MAALLFDNGVWLHFSDHFICKGVDIGIYLILTGDGFNTPLSRLLPESVVVSVVFGV